MSSKFRVTAATIAGALGGMVWGISPAQSTFTENFTGASTANNWYYFNGACLTAGGSSGTGAAGVTPGNIPSCISILNSYYKTRPDGDGDPTLVGGANGTLPDPVGQGALRFTNGYPYGHKESGAIVSATTFNAGQGIQITFKAVTYRGDSGGAGGDGADGMSFYLLDATQTINGNLNVPGNGIWDGLGSFGGSLGYTCSNNNSPYTGVIGGYLAIGMDEFGNFLNQGDNTAAGYGYVPGRIGLRGAGSVSWPYLNATYSTYYPSSVLNTAALQAAAVQQTCSTGQVWNYAGSATNPTAVTNPSPALLDYAPIANAYSILPATVTLANEAAQTRPNGTTSQNVFLYNLKITQDGLLTFKYSLNGGAYVPVVSNYSIVGSNGALPATLRFGFAGSTGGDTNVHEILCFKATPVDTSASSAAGNEKQTADVQTNAQAYFAYYNPNDYTGTAAAYTIIDTGGILTLGTTANWDASCLLTGIAAGATCATTGANGPTAATPAYNSRVMLTFNGLDTTTSTGSAGIPFEWTSGITAAEQAVIDAGDATPLNANRLNYIRGQRTNEIQSDGSGLFRARDGVLGDIVDASPTWVGPPNSPYVQTWQDNLAPSTVMAENSGQSYLAFQSAQQSRLNVVYVGANDGFLHGFEAGSETASGNLVANSTTPNDGLEVLAYMPGAVLNTIHNPTTPSLDFSNTQYSHNFYVDATPGTGDIYYGGAWHTWLVGGLGAGGSAIYALDITNAQTGSAPFSESGAGAVVKGEWSSSTLTCASAPTACGINLGNTYGTPQIRRFHSGNWGAVFGNGLGSASGDAGIYVMLLDKNTAAATFYYLSTGTVGTGNGIASVTTADLDGDHITDYVYAADLKGNVWRFDLTSATPGNWALTTPGPLFTTPAGQPITTPLIVAGALIVGSTPQIIVAFGTGQRNQFTSTSAASYISGNQYLYGVWDWNLTSWDNLPTQAAQYAALTASQMGTASRLSFPYTMGPSSLQLQTFTDTLNTSGQISSVDTSNTPITWAQCSPACNRGSFGWYAMLPGTQGATTGPNGTGSAITEQIVSPPSLFQSALIVNSTIPANNLPLNCNTPTTDSGVLYVINVTTGGTFNTAAAGSPPNLASAFVNYHDTNLIGLGTNETGAASVLTTTENTTYVLGQLIAPTPSVPGGLNQIALPNNTTATRQTWVELR